MNDKEDFICFMKECSLTPEQLEHAKGHIFVFDRDQEGICFKESPIEGVGCFTSRGFGNGEIIGNLTRNLTRMSEWTMLGRYVNHSPNQNTEVKDCGGRIYGVANRCIDEGEEITFNYRDIKAILMNNKSTNINTEAQVDYCVST